MLKVCFLCQRRIIANVQTATIKNVIVKKNTIHGNGYGSGLSLVGVVSSTLENMKVSNNVVKINRKENDPLISGDVALGAASRFFLPLPPRYNLQIAWFSKCIEDSAHISIWLYDVAPQSLHLYSVRR